MSNPFVVNIDPDALIGVIAGLSDEQLRPLAQRIAPLIEPPAAQQNRRGPLATVPEVAAYMACRRQRVDDLLTRGRLTRVKDGGRTLVRWDEVDRYLGGQPTGAVGEALSARGRVH
jgi:excisionase family DNA binding protein